MLSCRTSFRCHEGIPSTPRRTSLLRSRRKSPDHGTSPPATPRHTRPHCSTCTGRDPPGRPSSCSVRRVQLELFLHRTMFWMSAPLPSAIRASSVIETDFMGRAYKLFSPGAHQSSDGQGVQVIPPGAHQSSDGQGVQVIPERCSPDSLIDIAIGEVLLPQSMFHIHGPSTLLCG